MLRKIRNCDGRSNPGFRTVLGPHVLSRCPVALLTPMTRALFRRWRRARTFGAPVVGDPEDTPEFVAQAMEALEVAAAESADVPNEP